MIEQKIIKIAHFSDIHIPENPKRHPEFKEVFDKSFEKLKEQKPDRIVVVGDLFHNKLKISNEAKLLAAYYLNNLASIAPVKITLGNHDLNIKNMKRVDCIEAVVTLINNPNVQYLNKSGFYLDENVVWVVWHHPDHYSPWSELNLREHDNFHCEIDELLAENDIQKIKELGYKFIDLYHDPINGCKLFNGNTLEKDSYVGLNAFNGSYLMAGDIHLRQMYYK